MHWHEERLPGLTQPIQYERNPYLAAGVTTARELGGNFDKTKEWRAQSAAHAIVAPRIVLFTRPSPGTRKPLPSLHVLEWNMGSGGTPLWRRHRPDENQVTPA